MKTIYAMMFDGHVHSIYEDKSARDAVLAAIQAIPWVDIGPSFPGWDHSFERCVRIGYDEHSNEESRGPVGGCGFYAAEFILRESSDPIPTVTAEK